MGVLYVDWLVVPADMLDHGIGGVVVGVVGVTGVESLLKREGLEEDEGNRHDADKYRHQED
jgi:hypothetical protein